MESAESTAKSESIDCEVKSCTGPNPRAYLALIESLGHTVLTQDQAQLFEHAQTLASACEGDDTVSTIERYIELIRSTRNRIDEDPELDRKLVVAASNAISILSYAYTCGLSTVGLHVFKDFSYCRIPYANFSASILYGCNFDHADLSEATFFRTELRNCTLKHANLRCATTYQDRFCARTYPDLGGWRLVHVSPDESEFATVFQPSPSQRITEIWIWDSTTMDLRRKLFLQEAYHIYGLSYSPDGHYIAIATWTRDALVLDAGTGVIKQRVGTHEDSILSVAYHPDGLHLVTATLRGSMHLWDLSCDPPTCLWNSPGEGTPVSDMQLSQDGTKLALIMPITDYAEVRILESITGRVLHSRRFPDSSVAPHGMQFSSDGNFLALVCSKQLTILDVTSGEAVVEVPGLAGFSAVFDALSSDTVFTLCELRGINVWKLPQLFGPYLASLSDHRFISYDNIIHANGVAWDSNISAHMQPRSIAHECIHQICFHPDGEFIAYQANQGICLRERASMHLVASKRYPSSGADRVIQNGFDPNCVLVVSEDGRRTVCNGIGWVVVIDTMSCRPTHLFHSELLLLPFSGELDDAILCQVGLNYSTVYALSPDGDKLALSARVNEHNGVLLFDLAHNTTIASLSLGECASLGQVGGLCFSHDGAKLCGVQKDGYVIVWDVASQEVIFTAIPASRPKAFVHSFVPVAFSPVDNRVATIGPSNCVCIWDLYEPKPIWTVHTAAIVRLAWSSDGCLLISGGGDGVRFWDTNTWKCVCYCKDTGPIRSMSLSKSAKFLATLDTEGVFMIWELTLVRNDDEATSTENVSRVDLKLSMVDRSPIDSGPPCLLGDFEGAELNPSLQRHIERDIAPKWFSEE